MQLSSVYKNPTVLFALFLLFFSLNKTLKDDLSTVIRSDGSGYYAYLPALFIFNDPTFETSTKAEALYLRQQSSPLYLIHAPDNSIQNKYFPGVAVLQAPFFGMASCYSWLSGQTITGYSDTFSFFFYLGSLFYAFAGLFLFQKVLHVLFPENRRIINWLVPLFYVATPLFHYTINTPSFSHLYSFFLFSWFAWSILKLNEFASTGRFLLTGFILGLIVTVRPTNVFILLAIPLLLGDFAALQHFLKQVFRQRGKALMIGSLGLFSALILLFSIWKWESGHWILWSYTGEGFRILHPKLLATLFSFRIGLFIHTPILILSLVGLFTLWKTNRFQAIFWVLYFSINTWIIASWWCWDYESPFGNRPYTEHLLFLLLPIVPFVLNHLRRGFMFISLCAILGIIRIWSFNSAYMTNQRFTPSSYFSSLAFWNATNANRWNYTRSCVPYGERILENILLDVPGIQNFTSNETFIFSVETKLHENRSNERFYYRVELDKHINEQQFSEVYLVIDAVDSQSENRYYYATELLNDRFEGRRDWAHLIFEGIIHDNLQEYDQIKIYIWNAGKRSFSLRNTKIILEEYKS